MGGPVAHCRTVFPNFFPIISVFVPATRSRKNYISSGKKITHLLIFEIRAKKFFTHLLIFEIRASGMSEPDSERNFFTHLLIFEIRVDGNARTR